MRKVLSLMLGIGLGAAVGVILVMLFAPVTGDQLVSNLKEGWQETLDEARQASQKRRRELEADLAARRGS
jgi:gas vesicle protein